MGINIAWLLLPPIQFIIPKAPAQVWPLSGAPQRSKDTIAYQRCLVHQMTTAWSRTHCWIIFSAELIGYFCSSTFYSSDLDLAPGKTFADFNIKEASTLGLEAELDKLPGFSSRNMCVNDLFRPATPWLVVGLFGPAAEIARSMTEWRKEILQWTCNSSKQWILWQYFIFCNDLLK